MSDENWSGSWCPQCGPDVSIDEDGCCAICGADATGEGAERALALREQRDAALRDLAAVRAELAEARTILSEAVGHEDEPGETLADCARLLVLDCDAEHERANAADKELAAVCKQRCEACRWWCDGIPLIAGMKPTEPGCSLPDNAEGACDGFDPWEES